MLLGDQVINIGIMKFRIIMFLLFAGILFQCSDKIVSGDDLSKDDINYIQNLGVLAKGESIIKFYSNYTTKISGNFYTSKRLVSYWQYDKKPQDSFIKQAFYGDVSDIGVEYGDGFELTSALLVKLKNGDSFKVNSFCLAKPSHPLPPNTVPTAAPDT